jgi:hypothetical protein
LHPFSSSSLFCLSVCLSIPVFVISDRKVPRRCWWHFPSSRPLSLSLPSVVVWLQLWEKQTLEHFRRKEYSRGNRPTGPEWSSRSPLRVLKADFSPRNVLLARTDKGELTNTTVQCFFPKNFGLWPKWWSSIGRCRKRGWWSSLPSFSPILVTMIHRTWFK